MISSNICTCTLFCVPYDCVPIFTDNEGHMFQVERALQRDDPCVPEGGPTGSCGP